MAGLYVHIPFCHSKCAYCDFYSMPRMAHAEEYVEALEREFLTRRHEIGKVTTVYIGGGTPSSLPLNLLDQLIGWLPMDHASEITIEVNPEDVTGEFAEWVARSAINRVSMGVQSLCDRELAIIGRRHSAADAIEAYHRLRSAWVGNISLDLIFGLPGQTTESWEKTLETLLALGPEHLSAYTLMLESGTRLRAMSDAGKLTLPGENEVERMYKMLCESAAGYGYEHYEISNFAKPGFRSQHNSSYWNLTPYLGLGPGAHSFDGETRRYNPGSLKEYLQHPDRHTLVEAETEMERINDYIMIRLRTCEGLSLEELSKKFGEVAAASVRESTSRHIERGDIVERADGVIIIPEERILIADSIISDLMLI